MTANPASRKLLAETCASAYSQCGGTSCQGSGCPSSLDSTWTCCPSEYSCHRQDQYYWQCLPGNATAASGTQGSSPSTPNSPATTAMSSPSVSTFPSSPLLSPAAVSSPEGDGRGNTVPALHPDVVHSICRCVHTSRQFLHPLCCLASAIDVCACLHYTASILHGEPPAQVSGRPTLLMHASLFAATSIVCSCCVCIYSYVHDMDLPAAVHMHPDSTTSPAMASMLNNVQKKRKHHAVRRFYEEQLELLNNVYCMCREQPRKHP